MSRSERPEDDLADDLARLLHSVRDVAAEQAWLAEAVRAVGQADPMAPGHPVGAGETCRACPVCQGLAVLRQVRPEAYEHLAVAVSAAAAGVRALLSPQPEPADTETGEAEPMRTEPIEVERIEIGEGAE